MTDPAPQTNSETDEASEPKILTLTPTEVAVLVQSGRVAELLNVRETDHVDFKGAAYDCDIKKDKRDFVADVVSFANLRGGIIVLGIGAKPITGQSVEVAERFLGVQPGKVNRDQYLKVLKDHSVPLVRDVTVDVVKAKTPDGKTKEFGLIVVSAQVEQDKPFFAERIVADDGREVANAFGWPERSGDATYWHPASRVQQLVANGLQLRRSIAPINPDEVLDDERDLADEIAEIDEQTPSLVIQLEPVPRDKDIPNFFGEVAEAIRQWHPVRSMGFSFDTSWHQPTLRGNHLVGSSPGSAWVLNRQGVLTVGASFLWGNFLFTVPQSDSYLQIHPATLTEFVTEAIRDAYLFVGQHLKPSGWNVRVIVRNLLGEKPVAVTIPRNYFPNQPHPATIENESITVPTTGDWEADAFSLLVEIYGRCFGMNEELIYGGNAEAKKVDLPSLNKKG